MRLFDTHGNRLYLTQSERQAFLDAARLEPGNTYICGDFNLYRVSNFGSVGTCAETGFTR